MASSNTLHSAPVAPAIGSRIRATWLPTHTISGELEGVVLDAVPVATSNSLRLVVQSDDGLLHRAYTGDPHWIFHQPEPPEAA